MRATGRVVHRLLSAGLPMGPLYLLQTRGRRTQARREVPIAVLRTGDQQWLVSPFGAVAWVHNVRANGEAHLRRGRRRHRLHLVEVTDDGVPGVLRAYRRRFRAVPFVRAAFRTPPGGASDMVIGEAGGKPVFRIEEAAIGTPGTAPGRRGTAADADGPVRRSRVSGRVPARRGDGREHRDD